MQAGRQGLRRDDDLAGDIERVRPLLRGGDVGVDAVDSDLEVIHRRVVGAGGDADGAHRQVGGGMEAEGPLCAVQQAVPDELLGTGTHFLGGLEEEPDGAAEVGFFCGEDLGRSQQAGGVGVVAAGVHDAHVLGLVLGHMGLGDGQRVDVGAENDHALAGLAALQFGIHAGLAAAFVRDRQLVQLFFDPLCGPELMQADFRVGVELPPHRNDIFFPGLGLFCDRHPVSPLFPISAYCHAGM